MTRKMKVLIIASWYPCPSVPTAGIFIQRQAVALANLCDVAVLHVNVGASANESLPVTEQGITVARSGITSTGLYARYFGYRRAGLMAFAKLVESWGMPDIVHVQALWPAALVARAINQRWGIPYIVTEHSEEYLAQSRRRLVRTPGMLRFLLRPLAQRASATIAVSRYLGDRLVELGLADNVAIIPNALSSCKPASPVVTAPHVIAHVSVMGPAKNLPTLLHAIKDVMARRSDFLLRLVGDGECRGEAEGLAASLGLGDVVEFVGSRSADEVHDLYAQSAFTVVSSTHETFSVVAAESLMCGRPVVSTRCGGPEEFITPEVGRLVAAGSGEALADGIDWMLDHFAEYDPASLHDYAHGRFSHDAVARQILAVYRGVLNVR